MPGDTREREQQEDERTRVGERHSPEDLAAANDRTALQLQKLTVGVVIDQKYRIDEIIGRGAMGVVAAATHLHLKEKVALKFLSTRGHDGNDDFRSRFQREAQVSAKLRNEHITRVMDVGVWNDAVPFMVMDHLVGADLRQTFRAQGQLPLGVALDYVVQICEGMAEAHAHGIIHRDLKPSNLFVTQRADGSDLIKILDFGISKWAASDTKLDDLTRTGVVLGSPKYMSPEQLFGSSAVDARADVWSIAAIFYEMVSGRPPYDQPTLVAICAELGGGKLPPRLSELGMDVTPALDEAVMRCFARDPEARVQNVAELAFVLLDAIGAPFAAAVEQKISAVLAPAAVRGAPFTGSGAYGNTTGAYGSLSASVSGSSAPRRLSATGSGSISQPIAPVSVPPPAPRSRLVLALLAFALGAAALAAVLAMGSRDAPPPIPTSPLAPTVAVTPPTAPPAPLPSVPPTDESARPATIASPAPAPRAPAPRAPWRPAPHAPARAVDPPPPPPPAANPTPPASTPAAAESAKRRATPVNPLEDRQ